MKLDVMDSQWMAWTRQWTACDGLDGTGSIGLAMDSLRSRQWTACGVGNGRHAMGRLDGLRWETWTAPYGTTGQLAGRAWQLMRAMYGSASHDGLDGLDNGLDGLNNVWLGVGRWIGRARQWTARRSRDVWLGGRAMYGSASYDGWDGSAMGPLGVARWIGRARQWTLCREMYGLALHDGKFHE